MFVVSRIILSVVDTFAWATLLLQAVRKKNSIDKAQFSWPILD